MSVKHSLTYGIRSDSGLTTLSGTGVELGSAEIPVNQDVPCGRVVGRRRDGGRVLAYDLPIHLLGRLGQLFDHLHRAVPDGRLLVANIPYIWERSAGYFSTSNPFGADVTAGDPSRRAHARRHHPRPDPPRMKTITISGIPEIKRALRKLEAKVTRKIVRAEMRKGLEAGRRRGQRRRPRRRDGQAQGLGEGPLGPLPRRPDLHADRHRQG